MSLRPIPALEAEWEPLLASVVPRRVDPRALALMVGRLSARYRGEDVALARADELAARALFWFPRDLVKAAVPAGELAFAGALPSRTLRVLDLGAGLGATSLGVMRALAHTHIVEHVTAIDREADALALMRRIAGEAPKRALLPTLASLVTEARDLTKPGWGAGLGTFDLVTAGLSLVEMTRSLGDETARGAALAGHIRDALAHVADDGALIVIEPALREETRALHRARDLLVGDGVTVFSPCLHQRGCPMLKNERDWCHEDLAEVSLPAWLVPVAREAGLRYEGPTFSYLVLRKDGRTLRDATAGDGVPVRLVSRPLATKGKTEVVVCGDLPASPGVRVMELRRDAKGADAPTLDERTRGDLIAVRPDAAAGLTGDRARLPPGAWEPVVEPRGPR